MAKQPKKINDKILQGLYEIFVKAFRGEHYLESAIIGFQLVELFLRSVIYGFARGNFSPENIIKRLESEQRFFQLVIFLGLVKPDDNGLCDKLFKFNENRNKIVHKLFYVKSLTTPKNTLKDFSKESMVIIEGLKCLALGIEQTKPKGVS